MDQLDQLDQLDLRDHSTFVEGEPTMLAAADQAMLAQAVARLERQSFVMSLAAMAGMPIEALLRMLPPVAQTAVSTAVNRALEQCLRVALTATNKDAGASPHTRGHTLLTAATGAVGGFFGVAGLAVELPVTTTVMLHSIVEIARSYGEDLSQPESALSCLEVLAFSSDPGKADAMESAYYGTRTALAQATREAAAYLAEKGAAKKGVPALIEFLAKIGSRFGIEVTEKAAAQLIPIAGAIGGMTTNVLFTSHFQRLAQGHFAVRRIERIYGPETVRREYQKLRSALPRR